MWHRILCLLWLFASMANAGEITASADARFVGDFGMRINITDTAPAHVGDQSPAAETRYRARFYLRTAGLTMADNDRFILFEGRDQAGIAHFRVELEQMAGTVQLRFAARMDSGVFAETPPGEEIAVTRAWHVLEVDWETGPGTGALRTWFDGMATTALTALDNDEAEIDRVNLGAVSGLDTTTSGSVDLDEFRSTRNNAIGTLCFTGEELGQAMANWPQGVTVTDVLRYGDYACPTKR